MDWSDAVNRLTDIERAGEQRCDRSAHLAASGPLKALLLLQAAEHRSAAEALNDASVRLRGTPSAGDADALLRDPSGPGFPVGELGDGSLLASCIAEAEAAQAAYREVLDAGDPPDWLQQLLDQRLRVAQGQSDRLSQAREAIAPGAVRLATYSGTLAATPPASEIFTGGT